MISFPVDFSIECKINDKQKEKIKNRFNLEVGASDISLTYHTRIDDKLEKWFEIHYTEKGNRFQTANPKELSDILGESIMKDYDEKIKKKRKRIFGKD
jgi:hypothetical protein